ncbi:hypothetical protein FHS89_001773 [Rubricella aquisinus]|uniref:Late control protein D n=1 Tax=Rubricella aquisinus TaxID=2028108 RepID=A0A840WNT9_9RHOB|nr:contractile injection system protein, VgrG/Pvc8 family [Rubricella aquisinus]MBB5515753.1 hypothetical protein [Rubricella aquisinus]
MAHPSVTVTVDGTPITGPILSRLVSLTITDREGIQSDTVEMTFADGPPFVAAPRRGAVMSVSFSLDGLGVFVGAYVIDRVEFACMPYTITVKGHSADLRSAMKTSRSRHWDGASVRSVVEEIARQHDLAARISDAAARHVYDWLGQQDEADLAFLDRLARRHGALFTIKNQTLLWLERGAGRGVDADLPIVTIPASVIIEGSCRLSETDVDRFGTVKAFWQNTAAAEREAVVVPADPSATGEHVLREPFSSRAEAERAAQAAAREMQRGLIETSCAIVGRPSLMAGQPITYSGVRPMVDGRVFILEMVRHTFTKSSGLRTAFTGKLQAPTLG